MPIHFSTTDLQFAIAALKKSSSRPLALVTTVDLDSSQVLLGTVLMTRGVLGSEKKSGKALLESLLIRLPPSDRPRLRAYCYQLIATRYDHNLRSCSRNTRLPPYPRRLLHFQSSPARSWRAGAIPSNGLPPRPPPGQYRPRSPSHSTTLPTTSRAAHPSGSPVSPLTCSFHCVSLRSASGNSHGPGDRGSRW